MPYPGKGHAAFRKRWFSATAPTRHDPETSTRSLFAPYEFCEKCGLGGGLNLYGLVGNSSVNRVDFMGFCVSEREIDEKAGEENCEEEQIEIVIVGRMDISPHISQIFYCAPVCRHWRGFPWIRDFAGCRPGFTPESVRNPRQHSTSVRSSRIWEMSHSLGK